MALRGPHHSVGIATSVGEMIFRFLHARCQSAGGTLASSDLDEAKSHFIKTIPNAFDFFEKVNQFCMEASGATAQDSFARDTILGFLLQAVGQRPARRAFEMQVQRFGGPWLDQFFGGLAEWVRQRVPTADERLLKAYASASVRYGAKLAVADLLKQESVQATLRECLTPLVTADAGELSVPLSDQVSVYIATQRGIPKPDISKVTEQQMKNFLGWLPPQIVLTFTTAGNA